MKCTKIAFESIRAGDKVRFLYPSGGKTVGNKRIALFDDPKKTGIGRAVMPSPVGGWLLNTGGQHGVGALVDKRSFLSAKRCSE
jgi:hypothetical protein